MVVDKAIGRLGPFQDDIRTLLSMVGEESAVQSLTLSLEHTHFHLDACLAQLLDTTPLDLGKLIDTTNNYPLHTFLYDQISTRRCLAIMRTRLQADVDRSLRQQFLILWTDGSKGIHLRMTLTTTHMITLADDPAISTHNHSPHHRIRLRILLTVLG